MNEIFVFILGLLTGFIIGWFVNGLGWMKAIDADERRKHPEIFETKK